MALTQGFAGSGGGGGGGAVTMSAGAVSAGAYVSGALVDGAIATLGAITDAAVTGDTNGTVNAHLRGLTKIAGDVWDSVGHRLHVDASGTTVPITGTVTANQGTANTAANGWPVKTTDGTNVAAVKAASTAAVAADPAAVVALSPNSNAVVVSKTPGTVSPARSC